MTFRISSHNKNYWGTKTHLEAIQTLSTPLQDVKQEDKEGGNENEDKGNESGTVRATVLIVG